MLNLLKKLQYYDGNNNNINIVALNIIVIKILIEKRSTHFDDTMLQFGKIMLLKEKNPKGYIAANNC